MKADSIEIWSENRERILPYILGRALGLWLEISGRLVLHGALVEKGGGAIGFLAQSGMGKSTLLTALLAKGCKYLSDDLIAVRQASSQWITGPGLQQVRIWPDSGGYFYPKFETYAHVHPNYPKRKVSPQQVPGFRIGTTAVPLRELVVLQRKTAQSSKGPEWTRLKAGEAMVQLIAHSYNVEALEALGRQMNRLPQLARMAEEIPVWSFAYPSGFETLPILVEEMMKRWP